MKVPNPINPETQVSTRQLGYVKEARFPNFDLVAKAARDFSTFLETKEKEKEEFNISRAVIDESNALLVDFDKRSKENPLGNFKFSEEANTAYTERHAQLLQMFKEQGFSRRALEVLDLKFSGLRQGMLVRSMAFQTEQSKALGAKQAQDLGLGVSQYVQVNPNSLASGLEELRSAIDSLPDLTADDKLDLYEGQARTIRSGAARGLAVQDPDTIIRLLDPEGFEELADPKPTAVPGANTWQSVATTIASEFQLPPEQVAAVMSYETAGTFDPKIMGGKGGKYMGLIQFGPEERVKYGINADSTPAEWTIAISSFLKDRGFKPGMSILDFYSTINAGTPGRYDASDGNGTVSTHLQTILKEHLDKGSRWLRTEALASRLEDGLPITVIEPAPGTRKDAEVETVPPKVYNLDGKTGHPVLDLLTGEERMQALSWARQETHKNDAEIKAAMQVQHENTVNAYLTTGQYTGQLIPESQYIEVYGETVGKQKFAEVTAAGETGRAVQHFKTESNASILAEVERLRPKDTASPTYSVDFQAFERVQTAAQSIIKARQDDPANYLFSSYPNLAQQLQRAQTPQQRAQAYSAINEAYKQLQVPVSGRRIMSKQAAEELQRSYANMTPQQKLNSLETWHSELGELRSAFLNQMNDEGQGAGYDYFLRFALGDQPNYRTILSQVFAGQQIIREDPARKPSREMLNARFSDTIGAAMQSLNPASSRIFNEAAAAIYVANGGRTGPIGSIGAFDQDLYLKSLRQALGGVDSDARTGVVQMGSGNVKDWTILPPGVNQTELENFMDRLLPGSIEAISIEKLPPIYSTGQRANLKDIIDEGVPVMVAPNHYIIKMASDGKPLKTASGNNFIIVLGAEMIKSRQTQSTYRQRVGNVREEGGAF